MVVRTNLYNTSSLQTLNYGLVVAEADEGGDNLSEDRRDGALGQISKDELQKLIIDYGLLVGIPISQRPVKQD